MAGKYSETEKDAKMGNKWNSNMVKVSSSKSILSYQNGSALNIESFNEMVPNGYPEENSGGDANCCEGQNLKSECLDIVRKKLISDLSLDVFSTDLENKLTKMEPIEITKEKQAVIQKLVVQISQLSDAEKLLLYLKLPSSTSSPFDPLRQPLNPLGNRQEIQQTIVWIKTHLEEDREISIPKQDVYDQYLKYCENVSMKPLSTADFGKVMKQVYPGVRPRRLGTRGNSRYCYSGMRNTCKLPTPVLPLLGMENTITNGSSTDGSSTSSSAEKEKKTEKPKRKWKPPNCGGGKMCPSGSPDKDTGSQIKHAKRSKVEGTTKAKEATLCEEKTVILGTVKKEELILEDVKCEETSDNSFNAFDNIDYELGNDLSQGLGIYFENIDRVDDGSSESEEKSKPCNVSEGVEKKPFASMNGDAKPAEDKHINNKKDINGLDCNKNPVGQRLRRNSTRSFKKCYVPIQPKPYTPKLNIRFDFGQFPVLEPRKDKEGVPLCEESDSQEPEEEMLRYFQHIEENQIVGSDVFVGQAVKNIENSLVQINGISQDFSNSNHILNDNESNRSQSCFDCRPFNSRDNCARSQSSVEFESGKNVGKKEKLSHLRILLEKSMPSENKAGSITFAPENPMTSNNPTVRNEMPLSSNLDIMKLVNRGPVHVPQSPNTRTKNFSFTPISPGPQSPLKTPSTPSASPFVSPRNTPVPRSRQNSSQNDHFIPPSKPNRNLSNLPNEPVFEEAIQNYRPRSFSSTNFYRSKARRNLSKMLSYDGASTIVDQSQQVFQPPLQLNHNLIINDSLSSIEVRRLLENSKEGQVSSFRSQSVPLNRMISESSWLSSQVTPQYNLFNMVNQTTPTPVPSEYSDFDCSKDVTQSFIPNGEMTDLNQVFPGESQSIPQLNDPIFPNEPFTEFPNTNSESAFDAAFTNPDSVLPDMKEFLPSFDKPEGSGDVADNGKLFKTGLYEENNENVKDPVITAFKPTMMPEFSSSPDLGLFGSKMTEDNQLIEFLDLDG